MPGNWGHTPSPGPLVSDWVPRYWGWLGRVLVGLRVRSQGCQPEPPGPRSSAEPAACPTAWLAALCASPGRQGCPEHQ